MSQKDEMMYTVDIRDSEGDLDEGNSFETYEAAREFMAKTHERGGRVIRVWVDNLTTGQSSRIR